LAGIGCWHDQKQKTFQEGVPFGGVVPYWGALMEKLKLLSTDFDGTLIGLGGQERCVASLAGALDAAKATGALWAINTGRSLEFALAGLEQLCAPWVPSYLIVNERHIFGRIGSDWHSLADWNETCDLAHRELFTRCGNLLHEIRRWVALHADVELLPSPEAPEGIVTRNEAVMEEAVRFLQEAAQAFPDFSWQRNTIYLRFSHYDYHKGAALGCLSRELSLHAGEILAAGDHYNDLSMLNPQLASMLVCPGNAIQEVRSTVLAAGGFTSAHAFGEGTAEGISHYLGL